MLLGENIVILVEKRVIIGLPLTDVFFSILCFKLLANKLLLVYFVKYLTLPVLETLAAVAAVANH